MTQEERKGRHLQGLTVFDLITGTALGEVKDIIYCPETNRVMGFLISDDGWLRGARILLYDQVKAIGSDMIMVEGEDKIHNTKYHPDYKLFYQDKIDIRGYELVSDSGDVAGTIGDLVIDPSGKIVGYELSAGVVQDLLTGRKTVRVPGQVAVANGTVIFRSGSLENI